MRVVQSASFAALALVSMCACVYPGRARVPVPPPPVVPVPVPVPVPHKIHGNEVAMIAPVQHELGQRR